MSILNEAIKLYKNGEYHNHCYYLKKQAKYMMLVGLRQYNFM